MTKTAKQPHGPARIIAALATTAAGVGAGVVLVLLGFVAAGSCNAEGFACLGWLFAGAFAACAAAAIVMVLVGRRLGLGWAFGLVTSGIAALALLPLEGWVRALIVVLAPVTATVLTWPRSAAPEDGAPATGRRRVIVGGGLAILGLLIAVIGWSVVQQERTLLDYRATEYESTQLPVIGLPDDADWRYESVLALGGTSQEPPDLIGYYLTDETGIRIRVETELDQDSGAQPPGDCSTDPARIVPCTETVPKVYVANPETNQRLVVFGSAVTTVAVYDGTVSDADLDALSASLERRDARWLAARESWLYRVLG